MRLVRLVATLTFIAAALALAGCPKPPPGPNHPDAADAGPAQEDAAPPPSCSEVCAHVELPPPGGLGCNTGGACMDICRRVKRPGFRSCVLATSDCGAVDRCDR